MQSWIIWTTFPVRDEQLREFAERNGGYWNDVVGEEAVIERGDARVFLATATADDEQSVTREDVERAASVMHTQPKAVVWITLGHAAGSTELGNDVAKQMIESWGGILDRNT